MDALQSLPLQQAPAASRSLVWMPCLYLCLNDGQSAMALAAAVIRGFETEQWESCTGTGRTGCRCLAFRRAQVCLVNTHRHTIEAVARSFRSALHRAKRSRDVVRTARVIAPFLLG